MPHPLQQVSIHMLYHLLSQELVCLTLSGMTEILTQVESYNVVIEASHCLT
jgi:hypothetical protein